MNLRLVCLALVAAVLAAGEARAQMLRPTVSVSLISTRVRSQGQNPFIGAGVNVPESFDHGQGGEAGMIIRLARGPLEGRVGYRIDHAVLVAPTYQRRETVDGLVIGVGLNWR